MKQPRADLRPDAGVAMILVLAVLMSLMVLAVPFLTIATHENRGSEAVQARAEAKAIADGMLRYGAYALESNHRSQEALLAAQGVSEEAGKPFVRTTPFVDTAEESQIPVDLTNEKGEPLEDAEGNALLHRANPRGVTADLAVRDEQAWPNIVTAPPFLIAASLGRTTLQSDITDTDTEIPVEDATDFPAKNGAISIEGEIILYEERTASSFTGCQRGCAGGLKARRHRSDAYVIDDRAREIAMLPFASPRAKNGWREPSQPTYVKEIALLGRDALGVLEVDRIAEEFSVVGFRHVAGGFGEKTTVRAEIDPTKDDGTGFPIQVTSVEGFNAGTVVRITDGVNVDYGIVVQARGQGGLFGGGFGTIRLAEAPKNSYEQGRATVQPLLRHPVNINAAPEPVLTRIIEGVQYDPSGRGRGTEGRVTETAAAIVVKGIVAARPLSGLKAFRQLLEDLVLANPFVFTGFQAEAIFRNAVDANDVTLLHSTVPYCFESYDYYTLDAAAVVNDQSGRELARSMVRERVHASPSGRLSWLLDTQEDFENPLTRARSGKYVVSFPHPVSRWMSATAMPESRIPRMMWRFGGQAAAALLGDNGEEEKDENGTFEHGVFPDPNEGFVQLMPGRMESRGYNKHFDGPVMGIPDPGVALHRIDPNGWKLNAGPFEINPRDPSGGFGGGGQSMQVRERQVQRGGEMVVEVQVGGGRGGRGGGGGRRSNSGALMGRASPNPVRLDAWFNTGSAATGRQVFFDYVGENADEDRIQLVRENDGSLVARVHDRTLQDPLQSFQEIAVTRWVPEVAGFWRANTWYHLGIAYRGTKPEDVQIFVDGYKRGRSQYLSTLSAAMDDDDLNFSVEDAEGWPDRGTALVGTEVVAFTRSGSSFDVVDVQLQGGNWRGRGLRGTRVRYHPAGTMVSLYGYSGLPRGNDSSAAVVIPRGGGTLRDSLSTWCVASFAPNDVMTFTVPGPGGAPIPIQLEVLNPAQPNGNMLTLMNTSLGVPDFDAFPQSGGYVVIVSMDIPVSGAPEGGIEFAKYQSRGGNVLFGVQAVPNPPNDALAAAANTGAFAGLNIDPISLTRRVHPVRLAGGGSIPTMNTLSCVFPVSIPVSDVAGYKKPENVRGGGTGSWNTEPEFVQIGTPNTEALEQNLIEWIRYHHVDTSGNNLLCDEQVYILQAAGMLRARHLGTGGIYNAHQTLEPIFPFRGQCQTHLLSNGRLAAGAEVVPCIRTVSVTERGAINVEGYDPATNNDAPVNGEPWSFAGWGDSVTIEGQNGRDRKQAHVAWAGLDRADNGDDLNVTISIGNGQTITLARRPAYVGHGWIAFTESLGTEYRQRSLPRDGETNARTNYVRLLKFPSGELPDLGRGSRAFAGGDADGISAAADGWVDEIRVTPFEAEQYVLWNHQDMQFAQPPTQASARRAEIDESVDEIPIANVEWVVCNPTAYAPEPRFYILPDGRKIHFEEDLQGLPSNDAGLVRLGEEVIAFRGIGRGQTGGPALLDCQRGFMGTIPTKHAFGENVVFLDFVSVGMLQGAVDASAQWLPMASVGGFVQNGGTVLVDSEMIHYTDLATGGLSMPWAVDERGENSGGLFRGRFGTAPAGHDAQAIVLEMPFRYWDRYAARQDTGEQSFYGFSLNLPGAWFESIQFDEYRPVERVDIEVLCRTDPDVSWSADPRTTPGLFEFGEATDKDPGVIHRAGRGLDVRVAFKYLSGAFDTDLLTAQDWKASPELRSIQVHYLDETRVLGREATR